jgi:hypothetical protein
MRTLGNLLRRLADRIDHENAPRAVGWSFRFEEGVGIVWQEDAIGNQPPKGCRVWYFPKDYLLAHIDGQADD